MTGSRLASAALAALIASGAQAQYTFTTFAGSTGGTGAVDATGTAARFSSPTGVAVDTGGNVYVADLGNATIRKITAGGIVTTFAGVAGAFGTADGTRAAARFNAPWALAVDAAGNIYVADSSALTVRKITPAGAVSTIVTTGFSMYGIAVDAAGNIYVSDSNNHAIRKIDTNGVVSLFAGTPGTSGFDRYASVTRLAAHFNLPEGLSTDSGGNLYVADTYNNAIRKIDTAGNVTTVAGGGTAGTSDGPVQSTTVQPAQFAYPTGVAIDASGNVYVADTNNDTIRVIAGGNVTTVAGTAQQLGDLDATGTAARLYAPVALAVRGGTLYIADEGNNKIRTMATSGYAVSTLAGASSVPVEVDATGTAARFDEPEGIAVDRGTGNVYVTDWDAGTVRLISSIGVVSTIATGFNRPSAIVFDSGRNALYVTDVGSYTVKKISLADNSVTTLAGSPGSPGCSDTSATVIAQFSGLTGIAIDTGGTVYVSDAGCNTIRQIAPDTGAVTTITTDVPFNNPEGIAVDGRGTIYVADMFTYTIKTVTAGTVTVLAGSPGSFGSADGTGSAASFMFPGPLTIDGSGNVFVGDGNLIRMITSGGVVTTIGGAPNVAGNTDGTATVARFNNPQGIGVDSSGNLFIANTSDNAIRIGQPALADAATIDTATGALGDTRQLGTNPNTATTWLWSVVRRPSGSTAVLSSTTAQNPTFTPDVADLYTFQVTASSATNTSITTVDLTANAWTTTTALNSSANPSLVGQSVTFTATVASTAAGTPTGSVTFLDGTTVLGTRALASGQATFATSSLATGSHSITAAYGGDLTFSGSTSSALAQNVQYTTATAAASSANPSNFGQNVTFTATVTSSGGTPTGNVTFFDGATTLATVALSGGHATYATALLAAGTHSVTAAYGGDTSFAGSTSSALTQDVQYTTATAVASSANPSNFGQNVTFTATVTSSGGTPSGNVTFFDGTTALTTVALSGGHATYATASLTGGTHSISASYAGTATFAASSGGVSQVVNYATATALVSSANPSTLGQSVTFTATVTSTGGGTPSGTVTFKDGSAPLATLSLNGSGQAAYSIANLSVAAHSMTAVYNGATNYAASTSSVLTQTVNPAPFGPPPLFSATAISTTQVSVIWGQVSGATGYEVWRSSMHGAFALRMSTTGATATAIVDTGLTPNTTYVYEVRTIGSSGPSAFTLPDAATTIVFTDPSLSGVAVKAVHIVELRTAVNAMLAAGGLPAATFTDSSLTGVFVKAIHIAELRSNLDAARHAIGVPALTYTDPTITVGSTTIKAAHLTEIRAGTQ